MITGIIGLSTGRVQDGGAAIIDRTIPDYYCQLLPSAPDWTTKWDHCEERDPSAPTLFYFLKQVNESWLPMSEYGCAPYHGIRRGFLWLQWWGLFVAGILRIHGATEWTVWAPSGDQRIQHVFKARRGSIDVSYPKEGIYVIWMSDSPIWVWQVCDSLTERIHTNWWQPRWTHCVSWRLSLDCHGKTSRILGSTCKVFDFWLFNPRMSGRGGSGPGRPSGMPRECTWITAREDACSEGGGGDPDISVLGTNAFDDQLASEEVVWMFFLTVGVRIGLLGVTVEIISSGEIGTRHWTGEQGAAVAMARKRFPRVYSCKHCRHAETRREYCTVGLGFSMGEPFYIRAPW